MTRPKADHLDTKCGECLLFGAIQGLDDGLILVDTDGKVFHLNRRAEEMLGPGLPAPVLGRPVTQILDGHPLGSFWRSGRQETAPVTTDLKQPDGIMLRATLTRCLSASGDPIGRAMLLRDITHEKKIQLELSDTVARRLMEMTGGPEPAGDLEHLTNREMQILRLLATGLTNAAIASELHVSANTVATHLKHLYAKIDVKSRSEAAAFAVAHGIRPPQK